MNRVVEITGARPNFMKVAPVHRALLTAGFQTTLVHTGQHYDWAMSQVFLNDLGLQKSDYDLGVGAGTHAQQTAEIMQSLEPILLEEHPDLVVVVGDVNSTVAAALTAAKLTIPVAHVEAGLRSFDRSMPEEINRVVTDVLSELLFAPSTDAVENLRSEGVSDERIHLVGNVMIDSLEALLPRASQSSVLDELGLAERGYLLATIHRPSNVDDAETLSCVVQILEAVAARVPVILVAHPRTDQRLRQFGLYPVSADARVVSPMGYIDFLRLMMSARGVLTDSGGIQEETTVLGVPCLTLRSNTERPITVTEGTNQIVGLDAEMIMNAVGQITTNQTTPHRPKLWDGHASERIISVLERWST